MDNTSISYKSENIINSFNIDKKKKIITTIILSVLSFIIPFIMLIIIFSGNKIAPFGDSSMLMIDAQSQYISYLRYFKSILAGENSLIYTQSKVFGGDFMSIFTYYLASPFNIFLAFTPVESIPVFLVITSMLKMSLASLNFYFLFYIAFLFLSNLFYFCASIFLFHLIFFLLPHLIVLF